MQLQGQHCEPLYIAMTMSIMTDGRVTNWMAEMIGKTLMKFVRLPVETIDA